MPHSWPRPSGKRPRPQAELDLRPPRYRLMQAASKLAHRHPNRTTVSFERDCPACGRAVLFTQVGWPAEAALLVDDHDCV